MARDRLGVDAREMIEAINDVGVQARALGIPKVAERAGVKPSIVKKFISDPMKSKNSDVRKIREAIRAMLAEKDAGATPA